MIPYMRRRARRALGSIFLLTTAVLLVTACDPAPKTRQETKQDQIHSTTMAHLRLELWEEIRIERMNTNGKLTLLETKNYTTRTKHDASLRVQIPATLRDEVKRTREAFANGATTMPTTKGAE